MLCRKKIAQEFRVLILVNSLSEVKKNHLEAIKANLSFRGKESETSNRL